MDNTLTSFSDRLMSMATIGAIAIGFIIALGVIIVGFSLMRGVKWRTLIPVIALTVLVAIIVAFTSVVPYVLDALDESHEEYAGEFTVLEKYELLGSDYIKLRLDNDGKLVNCPSLISDDALVAGESYYGSLFFGKNSGALIDAFTIE